MFITRIEMETTPTKAKSRATNKLSAVPPYIRWYNTHHHLLAQLPADLREIVSVVATLNPSQRRRWRRAANRIAPRAGTLIVRVVES